MIIMKADATEEEIAGVVKEIKKYGLRADVSTGSYRTVIGLVGDERKAPFEHFATLPGVKEARMVEAPYKLISREYSNSVRNKLMNEMDILRLSNHYYGT